MLYREVLANSVRGSNGGLGSIEEVCSSVLNVLKGFWNSCRRVFSQLLVKWRLLVSESAAVKDDGLNGGGAEVGLGGKIIAISTWEEDHDRQWSV